MLPRISRTSKHSGLSLLPTKTLPAASTPALALVVALILLALLFGLAIACHVWLEAWNDVLRILTPGGGGWGAISE